MKFLSQFHNYLQRVASHYTPDEENSERLMLKYFEYLLKVRSFLKEKYSLNVLGNLDNFPIDTDPGLKEFHEKIAAKLEQDTILSPTHNRNDRFYIQKKKPFFVDQKIYYEVTFMATSVNTSKFDRVIAFTSLDILPYYAVKLVLVEESINIVGRTMPILIINDWEVSIRPCEIDNFNRIFVSNNVKTSSKNAGYLELMRFLTKTGFHLLEIIDFPDHEYMRVKGKITEKSTAFVFFSTLDQCRERNKYNARGGNVTGYLLLRLNNEIIKKQTDRTRTNDRLSGLYLKNGSIPFDDMPFNTSLIDHNPKLSDLFECLSSENRAHELLARRIQNNAEVQGNLYTSIEDASQFGDIDTLILAYNTKLWPGHPGRKIEKRHDHLYIAEYEENTRFALLKLQDLASLGIKNYSSSVASWISQGTYSIDCEEKKKALEEMFENSKVALIYGSAGTGKSTLINHISHFFARYTKLYLTNTNPAIDNLKRRVSADTTNCTFLTIASFLHKKNIPTNYDLLIIDECSTVSNRDIRDILEKTTFQLLVLVGDNYQIEAIRFGNWFEAARNFIPPTSIFDLTKPYRSQNKDLLEFWRKVRNREDTILEHITKKNYSCRLDASIFNQANDEEIILCLNYDGLYGINYTNLILQQNNPDPVVRWGIQNYKVNDPILFNESKRFDPLIYNNTKGKIARIEVLEDRNQIQFDIELDKAINEMDARNHDFTLLKNSANGNSVIRFTVNKLKATDEDDDGSASDTVPFQVAYAISIHKAQGLEYESVKIVITDEIDELVTHNIFYTAITRARSELKIYWSPEVEKKVLDRFKTKKSNKDIYLLKLSDPKLTANVSAKLVSSQ